ncbi:hypothetical protein ACFPPD_12180 [Cohnella suwonensis]|uniref:Uncharacterized protein n=1 Tax=Cohnella suwonensis TaxID=696072 RepID=A0ABW0LVY4_9BACL
MRTGRGRYVAAFSSIAARPGVTRTRASRSEAFPKGAFTRQDGLKRRVAPREHTNIALVPDDPRIVAGRELFI